MMPCDRSQPGKLEVTKLSGAIRACDRRKRLRRHAERVHSRHSYRVDVSRNLVELPDPLIQDLQITYQDSEPGGDIFA